MSVITRNGVVIHTSFDNPPIPNRGADWSAVTADYDGGDIDYNTPSRDPIGRGATEEEAIADLLEKIEEMA
jgi:hypothetical protein